MRSADFIFKTIWAIAFLGRMWYGKETTIIWVKTIYLLYFEYIICHLFSYLISWTNISSNTILFIIINSVMVICRGAACIFSGKYICFLFLLCQKDFARILGYLQISLFCVFLFNSLFLYYRNLYTLWNVYYTKVQLSEFVRF